MKWKNIYVEIATKTYTHALIKNMAETASTVPLRPYAHNAEQENEDSCFLSRITNSKRFPLVNFVLTPNPVNLKSALYLSS